jgi:hypothetical protein
MDNKEAYAKFSESQVSIDGISVLLSESLAVSRKLCK